jgi:TolB-like protein
MIFSEKIQETLDLIISNLNGTPTRFSLENYKKIKAGISGVKLAESIGISPAMLSEFEASVDQYYKYRNNPEKGKLSCFRISLWLETLCAKTNIPFNVDEALSTEEIAIKQARALELMIRDVLTEELGGKENVITKLRSLFKEEIIDKWLNSADHTGILSGTTFSELSNILLDKNIFKSFEDIFKESNIQISANVRDSLRFILDDIRRIRNSIAHNKAVSKVQIEALNEYYRAIANVIKETKSNSVNPDVYLDIEKVNMSSFISTLKEDIRPITGDLGSIKEAVADIKDDTRTVRKRSAMIVGGLIGLLLISGLILFMVQRQSGATSEMGQDIKDVKDIVMGDAELKNMSSSDDLSATKDLNARTKNKDAKRLAILYFDNSGGEPDMEKLKKGLADMLISDLSNVSMLNIVERDKLEAILSEQQLSKSKNFDPATASKVGKLLGAQIILTGGYFDMLGSIRIDARFIDVETGKVLKSDGLDGQISDFFKLQKQLSWKIIRNMDVKLSPEEKKELEAKEKSVSLPLEELKKYSSALDLYDIGKKQEAKKILNLLLKSYPDFEPGNVLLKKL